MSGNIKIVPFLEDGQLTGVLGDAMSLNAMEENLVVMQNLTEQRGTLDKGKTLGPNGVYVMREVLMASIREAKRNRGMGLVALEPAVNIGGYICLFQATERNRRTFALRRIDRWKHFAPGEPPQQPAIMDVSQIGRIHTRQRRAAQKAIDDFKRAQGQWLKDETVYKERLRDSELRASRGFEAAALMVKVATRK